MARNTAQVEIEIQNQGAIAALQNVIGSVQTLNNEAIRLRFGFQSQFAVIQQTINAVLGSSIQLEQQLISIRASLAATNDIQSFGKSIADPLERISALAPATNRAIAQVRRDSLELANATSDEIISVFEIISGQVGNIGANLDDAAKLTKAFSASFSTLGLPLAGARQEVTAILQSQIDQNAALAKTLNINNTQIAQEKAKGTLVQFLIDKTASLAAGQSLVAKTFGGVTSNLVEVGQRVQEAFGKVVLPPLVEQLTKVYDVLVLAQPQIEAFFKNVGDGFIAISSGAKLVFDSVAPLLQNIGQTIGVIAQTSLPVLQTGLALTFGTLTLIGNVLTTTLTPVLKVLQSDFGKFAVTIGLTVVALNQLAPIVLGLAQSALSVLSVGAFSAKQGVLGLAQVLPVLATNMIGVISSIQAFNLALVESASKAVVGFVTAIPRATAEILRFAITTGTTATASLVGFAKSIPAIIVGLSGLALTAVPVAINALSTFALSTVPSASFSLLNFAKTAVPAVIAAMQTFITTTIPSATAALISFAVNGVRFAVANIGVLVASFATIAVAAVALAGAVAVLTGGFLAYKAAMDASKASQDAWKNSVNSTEKNVIDFTKRLKELQDQQKLGTITDEGRERLEGYKKLLKETASDIPRQIADLQKAVDENKVAGLFGINETEAKTEIERLKKLQAETLGVLDETKILGQKAQNQGDLKQQFSVVSDNFFKEFQNGTQLSVTQAKELIKTLDQEVELGIRSKESGLERLKALSQAEFILKDDRIAAAKAATAIIDKENKTQSESNGQKQAEIQAQIAAGQVSELDGIKSVSELRIAQNKREIEVIQEKLKFAIKGSQEEISLTTQLAKAKSESTKIETEAIQQQVQVLRGTLEREIQANTTLRTKAEQALQADLFALKLGGFENELQLQEQSLLQAKRNNEAEIFDKERQLEFDKTLLANFVGSQKEREDLILKIGNQEADIGKLQLAQTQNLLDRYKLLADVKVKSLENEKRETENVSKLLQSQNDLLQAQFKLESAITDAGIKASEQKLSVLKEAQEFVKKDGEARSNEELARIKKTRDEERARSLEKLSDSEKQAKLKEFQQQDQEESAKLAAEKQEKIDANNAEKKRLTIQRLSQLGISVGQSEVAIARQVFEEEQKLLELKARRFENEQSAARTQLEVQIQQSQIRDKQLQVESQIALIKAKASGDKEAITQALQLVNLTNEQVANNQKIGGFQRSTLLVTQEAERNNFNFEQDKAGFESRLRGADSGLRGLPINAQIQAQATGFTAPTTFDNASQIINKDVKANTQKVLSDRQNEIGDVADGAVAFENTSQQIADNFSRLPKSLDETKKKLNEVITASKELSDNPLFKSREEEKKRVETVKQSQVEAAKADLGTAKFVNQNLAAAGIANTPVDTPVTNLVESNSAVLGVAGIPKRRKLFTGGYAAPSEAVTVNEQGQEAATNLRTGETSLLPYGERQVIFGDTTYVHNASDTRQLLTANTSAAQAIADRNVEPQNNLVLDALGRIHDLIAGREAKLAVTNNFTNEARPDQRVYELTRAMIRATAV